MFISNSFYEIWQEPLIQTIEAFQGFVPLQGNILLITDRMPRVAGALATCFARCTSCAVLGVAQSQSNAKLLVDCPLNFLIFAGYQLNKDNYRTQLPGAARVLWASPDFPIQQELAQYSIPYQFEKFSSPGDFFHFLQTIAQ